MTDQDANEAPRAVDAAAPEPAKRAAKAAARVEWRRVLRRAVMGVRSTAEHPVTRRWGGLLLPLVLAAGAMGVHWWINVPNRIIESPGDQGAKDKAEKDKKKKAADRRNRTAKRNESRSAEELDADWERHGTVPFDEEPTRTTWARRHQVLISRAMEAARRSAFAGAPEDPSVQLVSPTCRTVRCRFVLRSPYPHELDLMSTALERLHEAGEPVWRSFEVEAGTPAADPARPAAEVEHTVQITVAFRTDDTDVNALEVPAATPEVEDEQGGEQNDEAPDEPDARAPG